MSGVRGAYHPGGHPAREPAWAGPCAPAGKPLAGCHGSAAPCRLTRRVGCGRCSLTGGLSPCPAEAGVEIKSSVTSHLMGRGITVNLCN